MLPLVILSACLIASSFNFSKGITVSSLNNGPVYSIPVELSPVLKCAGRSSTSIISLSVIIRHLSIVFSSSRTFHGQLYSYISFSARLEKPFDDF